MIEATKYLRWNGVCAVDPVNHPGTCNDNAGGPKPTVPPVRELSVRPSDDVDVGVSAELMRFEVDVLEVYPAITAAEEYVSIRVRFKSIDDLKSMVLQITDRTGRLVYAERLAAAKVWGLPDAFDEGAVPAEWHANDAERKATLDGAPYTVSVLVTKEDAPIALNLAAPPDDTIKRSPIPVGVRVPRLDRLLVRQLEIIQIDPHFAPSRTAAEEALVIGYETGGIGAQAVTLEIWSDHYEDGGMLIYQADVPEKADGVHVLRWNGEANCGGGALQGNKLINPLYSPYRVQLKCPALMLRSTEKAVKVLYHSITLAPGTYLEDPTNPPAQAATNAYVQHRLNELGYLAGPLDGALNPQTRRALRRYTWAQPNFLEGENINATVLVADDPKPTLIDALAAGTGRRALFEHANCIAEGVDSKVYIDHNYFYILWAHFSNDDGHSQRDQAKLDRFETPIEATIYLVSRLDYFFTDDNGVLAGEAAGPVTVEWTILDPPEATALAPTAAVGSPSRTRAYLTKTLTATAGAAGHLTNPQDNCPGAPNRGFRGADNHFRIGDVLLPYRGTAAGGAGVRSTVHADRANAQKVGKTGVLFLGTHVAGDNFIVQANLTFADRGGRQAALEAAHATYFGALNFAAIPSLGKRTGKMTIWRRQTVAANVDWPAPSANVIDWNAVKREYAMAHVELDTSALVSTSMATLMATKGLGAVINAQIFNLTSDGHNDHGAAQGAAYRDDQVYCGPAIPAQGDAEEGHTYVTRVNALLKAYLSADYLCDVALFIRNNLLQEEKAGQVTMRVLWHRPIRVLNRAKVFGKVVPHVGVPWNLDPQLFCIGLAGGVTMLQNQMMADHDDRFLVTHEIGHCLYLNHHETDKAKAASDTPTHHDLLDHNCIMSYPEGIASRNTPVAGQDLHWGKNSASVAHFCGKCVLKLRGWDIVGVGLPDDSA